MKFKNHNMSYLFSNKFKKTSGVVFCLSIPIGLFLLLTERIQDIFVVNVFSIFSMSVLRLNVTTANYLSKKGVFPNKEILDNKFKTFLYNIVSKIILNSKTEKY